MRKVALFVFLLICTLISSGQGKIASTNEFSVGLNGKTILVVAMDQIASIPARDIGDVRMLNSKGEEKNVRKSVKGILLRDVLTKITYDVASTKELNRYIFLTEATDGYKVVLSRNEVFNTDQILIVTESNGIPIQQSSDRIEILALREPGKGHIYIKGLKKMTIMRIE